jgi:excisionase family DNA binding protein
MSGAEDPTLMSPAEAPLGGPNHDRLLAAAEVAELLAVPERWIREHSRSGLLPHVRIGRYVRYRREAVMAWVVEQEQGGAAWRKHHPRAGAPPTPGTT